MKWIYWFNELKQDDLNVVGKKCANLGEMTKCGLPVPPGFALSMEAHQKFFKDSGLEKKINEMVSGATELIDKLDKLEVLSKKIRATIEEHSIPEELKNEILEQYYKLCQQTGQENVEVAVRSSGAVSAPGSYETILFVQGGEDLLKSLVKCWGSIFNARSLNHRMKTGISLTTPIGVAVIKMVNAKSAGVLFTINPVTGDRSKMIVEANYGLGESVVSGKVGPDRFRMNRITMEIEQRELGPKEEECVPNAARDAVEFKPVSEERRKVFCLSDEELIELLKLGRLVEKFFGGAPQDIEWAFDKDMPAGKDLMLLQVRPEQTYRAKQEKKAKEKKEKSSSSTEYISSFLTEGIKL